MNRYFIFALVSLMFQAAPLSAQDEDGELSEAPKRERAEKPRKQYPTRTVSGRVPDATIVFDLDPHVGWGRAIANGADRMEAAGLALQERVRAAYLRLAAEEPDRVRTVDADGTIDEVNARLCAALADVLPELGA